MGTNYYAKIITSHERKKELCDAIINNDFSLINELTSKMYGSIRIDYGEDEIIGGEIHLGKRSGGWKFCWDPNVFVIRNGHTEWEETPNGRSGHWIPEPNTAKYTYPLTKKGIHDFIFREDILIYDEYGELQDKEEFWNMALTWGYEKGNEGWDSVSYDEFEKKENPNYRCYPVTGDLTNLLIKEGYEFTSDTNSDFYSDGLRFAGFTDFS